MPQPSAPPRRQAGVGFIFAVILLDMLGVGLIIPVFPELVEQFRGGDTSSAAVAVGAIAACYAVAQFLCAPILGALSDRFGRRRILLLSMFGLGVDYLVMGYAPSLGWLFAGRIVAGVMGASITTANAYIADTSTAETRARNYGLVNVAFGVGFILGPIFGGLLGGIDLRLPFFAAAGLCLLNSLYGFLVLPESLAPENRSAFSLRKANPVSSIVHLRTYPLVASLAVAFLLLALAQRGLETSWVLYTGYRYGWNEFQNGLALAAVGVAAALVQGFLVRPAVTWLGERRAVLVGFGIGTLAFAGYGLAPNGLVLVTVIFAGSLGGIAGPAVQAIIAGTVKPTECCCWSARSVATEGSGAVGPATIDSARRFAMPFDSTSLPIRLFTASHERSWNPADIDFSQERSDWMSFSDDERNLLIRLISGFRVGERGVTHELAPLQFRFRQDGRLEDEMYVTAQMYEEARHVQFFETWLIEALPGRFGVDIPYPNLHGDMFSTRLPATMRALFEDDSPEALLNAIMLYHFYVEGVGAEASYPIYYKIFERTGKLPALNRGIRLIQRDEARHIGFGVYVLQRLLAEHPHLVDQFEAQVEAMRPFAEDGPNQTFAGFERGQAPFDLDYDEYRQLYLDKLEEMRQSIYDGRLAAAV